MVGTHDMPPAAAFLTGEQVTIRAELGLLTESEADERTAARAERDGWLAMLAREGLLGTPAGGAAVTPEEFTVALYGFLARTPALLIGVSLAEAVGERRPQNLPGTVNEYPNWRIPLADGAGAPVLLEDLPAHEGVRAVAEAVRGGSRGGLAGGADRVHA
jgi:4-alpha-glucanotransferase